MWEYVEHFEAAGLYGLAPLLIFSAVNFGFASVAAFYARLDLVTSQILGVCFGAIGITVGLFVGGSRDGVVGAAIPAVLTFISSFAVYQFGKQSYVKWRPILPVGLFCLVLGMISGASFGAVERNHFTERTRRYEEWRINYEKVEIPLRLKQLEKEFGFTETPKPAP